MNKITAKELRNIALAISKCKELQNAPERSKLVVQLLKKREQDNKPRKPFKS